jgi:transcriptional regulator with XRE-family HTH domain
LWFTISKKRGRDTFGAWFCVIFCNRDSIIKLSFSIVNALRVSFVKFVISYKKVVSALAFYDKFINLCAQKEVSPSFVAVEIGLSRTSAHGWKRGAVPQDSTIQKIANYFDVPFSYFAEEKAQTETPAPVKVLEILFKEATAEEQTEMLVRMIAQLPEDKQADLIRKVMFGKK